MFIAALFIIMENLEAIKTFLNRWWVNELADTSIKEHFPGIKGNKPSSHEKTQRNLKCMSVSEKRNRKDGIKYFLHSRGNHQQGERQPTGREKVFVNRMSDKKLIPQIHKKSFTTQ